MTVLERNFDLNDQIYRFLREKKTNAEIARSASISFHRIIAHGLVPDLPVFPVPALMLVLGGFLGLLLGVFIIYLVHFMKDRVNSEINIQKNCDTIVFAKIPYLKNPTHSEVVFGKAAIDLQVQGNLEKGSIISISSFIPEEGKRTIALGLAKATAVLGKRTALLDANDAYGGGSYENIHLLSIPQLCPDWKQPDKLKGFIESIRNEYDVLFIKNCPLSKDASALLLMSTANLNLFVLDSRRTKMKKAQEIDIMKEELGLKNTQFVLNRDEFTPSVYSQVKMAYKKYKATKSKNRV